MQYLGQIKDNIQQADDCFWLDCLKTNSDIKRCDINSHKTLHMFDNVRIDSISPWYTQMYVYDIIIEVWECVSIFTCEI